MPLKRWPFTILTIALSLALAGCPHLATPAEKQLSYRRFESISVNGVNLGDFLQQRSAIVIAGAEPALIASRGRDADIRLRPVAKDGFDIGSASAVQSDGYFLTAAHCLQRTPLFLLLPDESGARIAPARVVWRPPLDSKCDIALLKVQISRRPAFAMATDAEIHPGADVVSAGANGLAGGKLLSHFILISSDPAHDMPEVTAIVHSVPLAEGDSGGPLTTPSGDLIGIEVLARGLILGDPQAVALRPDPRWLEMIRQDRQLPHPATSPTTRPSAPLPHH